MRKLFLALALLLIFGITSVSAQSSTPPLLQLLARIPDTNTAHQDLSYIDYPALIAARPGAPTVSTWQQFEAQQKTQDSSGKLYMSALLGVAGAPEFFEYFMSQASNIPDVMGFDFFGADQIAGYGDPPYTVTILTGDISAASVIAAHEKRGYTVSSSNDLTLLCPKNGCDSGMQLDMKNRNLANLFGGSLGRSQPVLVADHFVASSSVIDGLNAVANLSAGSSLADNPDYRAAAEAITANGTLLQTYFLTPIEAAGSSGAPVQIGASPSEATEQAADQPSAGDALPQFNLVAFADTAAKDEEQTLIALVYGSQATAQAAAALFPDRLQNTLSQRTKETFAQLLDERSVTSIDTSVFKASTDRYVLIVTLHAPLPPTTPSDGSTQLKSMSLVYHLLLSSLFSRDLGWLATGM